MRFKVSIIISLLIHLSIFVLFSIKFTPKIKDVTKIEILPIPSKNHVSHSSNSTSVHTKGSKNSNSQKFNIEHEKELARKELEEQNLLLKKEYIFSTFFTRMRDQVEKDWRREVVKYWKKRALVRSYTTVVLMIIDSRGLVVEAVLIQSSGDTDLDNAALVSIKDKFLPNPPKGLIDDDGYGRIVNIFTVGK